MAAKSWFHGQLGDADEACPLDYEELDCSILREQQSSQTYQRQCSQGTATALGLMDGDRLFAEALNADTHSSLTSSYHPTREQDTQYHESSAYPNTPEVLSSSSEGSTPKSDASRESSSLNGSILAYDCEASGGLDWNTSLWAFEKSDGPFKLWNLNDDIELEKKQAIIVHHGKTYRLMSYYRQWESFTGAFIPPTRCERFTLFCEGRFGGARIRVAAKDLQILDDGQ